jgi:hypothetical protein
MVTVRAPHRHKNPSSTWPKPGISRLASGSRHIARRSAAKEESVATLLGTAARECKARPVNAVSGD